MVGGGGGLTIVEFRGHREVLHSGFSGGKPGIKTRIVSVVGYRYFLELFNSCETIFINTCHTVRAI